MPGADRRDEVRWLDICRHRVRQSSVSYVLLLQHHFVAGPRRIVAPLAPAKALPPTIVAPHIRIGHENYRAILLDMVSVSVGQIREVVASADDHLDAIMSGLDAIFRGYPVGLPP